VAADQAKENRRSLIPSSSIIIWAFHGRQRESY